MKLSLNSRITQNESSSIDSLQSMYKNGRNVSFSKRVAYKKAPSPGLLMHELIDILPLPTCALYTVVYREPALLAPRSHRKELLSFRDSTRST